MPRPRTRPKKLTDMTPIEAVKRQLQIAQQTLDKMKAAPDVMGGQWKVKMVAHWERRTAELKLQLKSIRSKDKVS